MRLRIDYRSESLNPPDFGIDSLIIRKPFLVSGIFQVPMKIDVPGHGFLADRPRLFCIGRNYALHAAEMNSPVPEIPMVFLKPSTALIPSGGVIQIPPQSNNVHHEVELVVVIGKRGRDIYPQDAMAHVAGYAVGLDMTARDIQSRAKEKGHPWSVAKGFDTFAPLGPLSPASVLPNPQQVAIRLRVNDQVVQEGNTRDMIFDIPALIAYCSSVFTLLPGDLIYTGTPEGVGPVREGDTLVAEVDGLEALTVRVAIGASSK